MFSVFLTMISQVVFTWRQMCATGIEVQILMRDKRVLVRLVPPVALGCTHDHFIFYDSRQRVVSTDGGPTIGFDITQNIRVSPHPTKLHSDTFSTQFIGEIRELAPVFQIGDLTTIGSFPPMAFPTPNPAFHTFTDVLAVSEDAHLLDSKLLGVTQTMVGGI